MSQPSGFPVHSPPHAPPAGLTVILQQITDLDFLITTILDQSRQLTGAQAGAVYLLDGGYLRFAQGRREGGRELWFSDLKLDGSSLAACTARERQSRNVPDLQRLPPDSGCRLLPSLDHFGLYLRRAVLSLPLKALDGDLVGVLQLYNPQSSPGRFRTFTGEELELAEAYAGPAASALKRAHATRGMFLRAIKIVQLRDPQESPRHALRVGAMAVEIFRALAPRQGISGEGRFRGEDLFRAAALVHDVGKAGLPDEILTKPGRLTPEERLIMERHVLIGAGLFADPNSELDRLAHKIILEHHERWDGRGYPGWVDPGTGLPLAGRESADGRAQGKKGEEISLWGRIAAAADVFDALTSKKVYKEAFDEDLAFQIMRQESGRHFDPEVVEALLGRREIIRNIKKRYQD